MDYFPEENDMELIGKIPLCKYCGNYARPNVCFTDIFMSGFIFKLFSNFLPICIF